MTEGWDGARNLLCVRLDTFGDVLMTGPAIRALRESGPRHRVTLLTSSRGADAAALLPEVDDVLVYDPPWMKATVGTDEAVGDRRMVETIRAARFDGAVIFTVYSQSPLPAALLCYLADVPRRLAYCRENPYGLLTDWQPELEPERLLRHEVRRQLDLVAAIGCATGNERLSLRIPPEAPTLVARELARAGVDRGRPWVVLHPGATAPSRRYPAAAFAEVARRLAGEMGWQVVLTGVESEAPIVEAVREESEAPLRSLAGRLSVGELAALLREAPLLISNNTGPVHVAAAVGTPVVVLYALTNPQHTPWGVPSRVLYHDVPCRFCYRSVCPEGHHHCLRLVAPDEVVRAAVELWEETGAGRGHHPANAATASSGTRPASTSPRARSSTSTPSAASSPLRVSGGVSSRTFEWRPT